MNTRRDTRRFLRIIKWRWMIEDLMPFSYNVFWNTSEYTSDTVRAVRAHTSGFQRVHWLHCERADTISRVSSESNAYVRN